ncbi:hypothetical protein [Nocardia neocaledoniensis]|uniref:hypothetical protein n=1 Tax=Nocardia neocaledoniensis TaxID=236511 RepID=UPI002457EBEC|nr:hypothetical protein [Nocardia neocaledoniensis]
MPATLRMQPEDSTYWLVREAFGWSVVLQILWRFPASPDRADLYAFNGRLRDSVLNRRLVRASVPVARHRWVHADLAPELQIDATPIAADSIELWSGTELYSSPLDPEHGPAWRLRGVAVDDGGFLLSLTALHLVADGRTMVNAAVDAMAGTAADPLSRQETVFSSVGMGLRDMLDGVGQVAAAGRGIALATTTLLRNRAPLPRRGRPRDRSTSTAATTPSPITVTDEQPSTAATERRPSKLPAHRRSPRAQCSWVRVSVDIAHWESVAREHGGTANTLFIAVLAGTLRASGYLDGGPLKLGIPVSTRTEDDDRGNATAGVSVLLADELVTGGDLGPLRRLCKEAFARLSTGRRAAHVHLLPLVSLLPTSLVVRAATAGSGMPDAVASNLGDFADELHRIGGVAATAVAFRGIAQGVDPGLTYRFGDGLQSWAIRSGGALTFSVAAFDEERFPDAEELRRLLSGELGGWGLRYRMW